MTDLSPRPGVPGPIRALPATTDHHPALRHLWLPFRHEMSTFTGELPAPDGAYRTGRLDHALDDAEPAWAAWVLTVGQRPVGFAVVRDLDRPIRVLSSFFLVAPVRRRGLGLDFARAVMVDRPGHWTVAYQEANVAAATFWTRLAAELDPGWSRERRTPPTRPDLPPDTWVTLRVLGPFTSG